MSPHEYDIDVFWGGEYFPVTATLYREGEYVVVKDGAGQEWYDIREEPEFSELTIYYPDTGDIMDDPMDKLAEHAKEMLREIYWDREIGG